MEHLPALAPATPPQPVSRYQLPEKALEDALIARMGGIVAPLPPIPAHRPAPVKQGKELKKWHADIRQKMLEISDRRWISINEFADQIGCDSSVVKSKATSMASSKLLKAKWFGRVRKYKRGAVLPKPARAKIVEERRASIVAAITGPMKMREIREATGVQRHIIGLDLIWLEARGLINRDLEKHGVPATYSPVEKESDQ